MKTLIKTAGIASVFSLLLVTNLGFASTRTALDQRTDTPTSAPTSKVAANLLQTHVNYAWVVYGGRGYHRAGYYGRGYGYGYRGVGYRGYGYRGYGYRHYGYYGARYYPNYYHSHYNTYRTGYGCYWMNGIRYCR